MGRPMPNLGPDWMQQMHDFTVGYSVEQVRSVLVQAHTAYGAVFYGLSEGLIVKHFFPQWPEAFIMEVLREKDRRDFLNSEQAFHP